MSNKRFMSLLAAVFLVSSSAVAIAQEAPAAGGPRLTLVDPLKDFGTVAKGSKIEWDFTLKNTGDKPLEILSVQPTCGCTVAEFDRAIQPGSTGKVHAVVDTTQFSGPISKGITVTSNDPTQPAAQLTMRAIVKPYVDVYPAGFMRFMLLEGDSATQSAILYSEEEKPLEIVRVDVPSEYVKVDLVKIEKVEERIDSGRPGQNQYKINVTVTGSEKKLGPLAEKIKIVTNSEHQPEYSFNLSGLDPPRISRDSRHPELRGDLEQRPRRGPHHRRQDQPDRDGRPVQGDEGGILQRRRDGRGETGGRPRNLRDHDQAQQGRQGRSDRWRRQDLYDGSQPPRIHASPQREHQSLTRSLRERRKGRALRLALFRV